MADLNGAGGFLGVLEGLVLLDACVVPRLQPGSAQAAVAIAKDRLRISPTLGIVFRKTQRKGIR